MTTYGALIRPTITSTNNGMALTTEHIMVPLSRRNFQQRYFREHLDVRQQLRCVLDFIKADWQLIRGQKTSGVSYDKTSQGQIVQRYKWPLFLSVSYSKLHHVYLAIPTPPMTLLRSNLKLTLTHNRIATQPSAPPESDIRAFISYDYTHTQAANY